MPVQLLALLSLPEIQVGQHSPPHTMSISPTLPRPWSSLLRPWSLRPDGRHSLDSVSVEHPLGRQAQWCPTLAWEAEISEDSPDSSSEPWGGPSPIECHVTSGGGPAHTALSLESWEAMPWPGGDLVVLLLNVELPTHI